MNKRKENLFFTLFVFVLAHSSRDYKGEKNRKLVTHSNPSPQYTKRTIWNYYRLDATAILPYIYSVIQGVNEEGKKEKKKRLFT